MTDDDINSLLDAVMVDAGISDDRHYEPKPRPAPVIETPRPSPPPSVAQRAAVPDGVVLLCGEHLTPEPVAWLWPGWLAEGKFHVLAGSPGEGKTTIAACIMAVVSRGGRFPDGSRCKPANVVIWSGEDDPADTLAPRLIAMGADMRRVYFVTGTRLDGDHVPFDPSRDLIALSERVSAIGGVALLVVDPVVSAVAADSHKNGEVRRALQPLVELGALLRCAVLGISHFSKGTAGRDPVERVTGSIAFGALARVVLVASRVKSDDGTRRVLARAKSNIGPDDGGFEYGIEQVQLVDFPGVEASRIAWGEAVAGTARELLAQAEDNGDDGPDDAAGFLRALLCDGAKPAKYVFGEATGAGFSRDQMQRAARRLGIERRKQGMAGGWVWALPAAEGGEGGNEGCTQDWPPSSPPSGASAPSSAGSDAEAF